MRALKIAAAAIAIGITGLPEEEAAEAEGAEGAEAEVGAGTALARQFMADKRKLCTDALQQSSTLPSRVGQHSPESVAHA